MKNLVGTLLALLVLTTGCGKKSVVIDGQFFGENDKTVYLEKLNPKGGSIVDSTKTDGKGKFTFIIKEEVSVPTFYNINMGNSYVPLLVENGEDVDINSMANIYYNYTVEGSKGSSLIKEFNTLVRNTTLKMDSLANLYEASVDLDRSQQIGREYEKTYITFKRDAIVFITKNSTSLASLLPLYKPYNMDGQFLFDQPSDYLYFVMLSDSLESRYPASDYVISLRNDINMLKTKQDNSLKFDSILNVSMNNAIGFIDLNMIDAKGKKQKISDIKGKVVLLSFTASEPVELKTLNNDLKTIYAKYKDQGFEIYQVFIDTNKAKWLNTVSNQQLPWICVSDLAGSNSIAVKQYNITKIPANILINKNGDIVSTDVTINNLDSAIADLI